MRRSSSALPRRGAHLVAALAITTGILSMSVPANASSDASAPAPTPQDSASTEPNPGTPTPAPSTPSPDPIDTPAPSPATTPPLPPTPAPGILPGPGLVGDLPLLSGSLSTPLPPSTVIPAALGRVFPTNPWIYNDLPGTRYLDERARNGTEVTRRHMGIDAQGAARQPIFAVADGVVVAGTWGTTSRDRDGWGNNVAISHSDGYATRYAHLADAPLVQIGDRITAGQLIGYMGASQYGVLEALDRHLHFEVTLNGRNVDPLAFLGAASPSLPASSATTPATGSRQLYEIRPGADQGYVTTATGLRVDSDVFVAVDMGGSSAQVMVSEGGTLKQLAVVDGAWTEIDTLLPLDATSLAGADTGTGFPELFAVEGGKLFHIVHDEVAGWTKTWTGHSTTGTVSAVRMPGDRLHGMLQQAGHLYHLFPAEGGLWNVSDTGQRVGTQFDAVYVGGRAPEVMTVLDAQVQRVVRGETAWGVATTGLPATGSLTAVQADAGWPVSLTAEPDGIDMTTVVGGMWTRYRYASLAPGPIDAVVVPGVGAVLYSLG